MPADHDIKVWVDGPTYLALRALAAADHRGLSDYIRHLILLHLQEESARERDAARVAETRVRGG
jgi:hypothetical protein